MSSFNTQNRISDSTQAVAASSKEFVGQHAVATTMTAFGLGISAGVALVYLLSDSRQQHEAGIAHRLGRQVLDAMANAVPDKLGNLGR